MRILALQPYYGGSHLAFQQGWIEHSQHHWTVLTLPPRHWKWRMRHSAVEFARQLNGQAELAEFDALFCTDMLNLAEFKGLARAPLGRLPTVVYFHENQFAYPNQVHDPRDLHFGFTNFTSCLAADEIWFNSAFNQSTFLSGLAQACRQWPDYSPRASIESLQAKSRIQCPGIDAHAVDQAKRRQVGQPAASSRPHLIWAARWEHDKNAECLWQALRLLRQQHADIVDWKLSVLGQSFRTVPPWFARIRDEFSEHIVTWGYQPARDAYWRALAEANIFVSTAHHEFFGIAAAEGIAAGLFPMLPNDLAYPELMAARTQPCRKKWFLYDGTPQGLAQSLATLMKNMDSPPWMAARSQLCEETRCRLDWRTRGPDLDQALESVKKSTD